MTKKNKIKIPGLVLTLGLVSLFTDAASEMIYPLVPVYVTFFGSGAVVLGIIEGVAETTAAMIKLVSGIIADRTGKRKSLVLIGYSLSSLVRPLTGIVSAGWEIYSFVYFSFAVLVYMSPSGQVVATFILFAVYAFFYAFTEGTEKAFVADLVPPGKRGTAFGLFNFSIGLGALPASLIFGFLYSYFDRLLPVFG
jgi:sugar phosphate permease